MHTNVLSLAISLLCYATYNSEATDPSAKNLEAVASLAQTMTDWAFLIIGGSIATLLGTSYHRPENRFVRYAYLAFIVGWMFLSQSIYFGSRVHRAYLGYLLVPPPNSEAAREIMRQLNTDGFQQLQTFKHGLIVFGIWLVIYLIWWVFNEQPSKQKC